jgi:hypothetical protein
MANGTAAPRNAIPGRRSANPYNGESGFSSMLDRFTAGVPVLVQLAGSGVARIVQIVSVVAVGAITWGELK